MGSLLSGIADIFGGISSSNASSADTAQLNQLLPILKALSQTQSGYAGQESGLAGGLAPGLGGGYASILAGLGLGGGGSTAPGTPGGAIGQGMNFYGQEASQGLSPQSIAAATGAFGQQSAQAQSSALDKYTGNNNAGLLEDLNLQRTQGAAGLGGTLAGMNQQAQTAGVQGGTGLALGALGGLGSTYGSLMGQASGATGAATQPIQYLSGVYGSAATAANTQAQQDWQGAAQGIGNTAAAFLPGGGGLGALGLGGGYNTGQPAPIYAPFGGYGMGQPGAGGFQGVGAGPY